MGSSRGSSRRGSVKSPQFSTIFLAVAAVLVLAASVHLVVRDPSPPSSSAVSVTDPPLTVTESEPTDEPDLLTIDASYGRPAPLALTLGDSYAQGVGAPGGGYVELVAAEMGWTTETFATPGGGYAKRGVDGDSLLDLYRAADVEEMRPDVVIVQSGLNDVSADNERTRAAVERLAKWLHRDLPDTPVVVVGQFWPFPPTPSSRARDAMIESVWSERANVAYLSPQGERWKFDTVDDRHPDAEGYAMIADEIVAAIRAEGWA